MLVVLHLSVLQASISDLSFLAAGEQVLLAASASLPSAVVILNALVQR